MFNNQGTKLWLRKKNLIFVDLLQSGSSREAEVHAEDEQSFLQRQLGALQGTGPGTGLQPPGGPHPPRGESPLRSAARTPGQINAQSSPKKVINKNTIWYYTIVFVGCRELKLSLMLIASDIW